MRVVSVPGRLVRHWVTGRVIDAQGIAYNPFCTTTQFYLGCGDLVLAEDEVAADPAPAEPDPAAATPAPSTASE